MFPAHGSGIGLGLIAGRMLVDAVADADDPGSEDALWRFYRQSVRDGGTAAAFRDVLDLDQREFVREWRAYVTALAQ